MYYSRPGAQHDCHHDTKVKPEAVTVVIEILMMGGKTPETRWAVNKRQVNKLENCYIWLVIYLNYTMMHGFTNLKKKKKNPKEISYIAVKMLHRFTVRNIMIDVLWAGLATI